MRTVIFVGLLTIADAIHPSKLDDTSLHFCAFILGVAMVMGVVEFIRGLLK